jgi:adenosylcobinamide-phosphate synthase
MTLPSNTVSAVGIGLGYLADAVLGDPQHWHPVAGFGRLAAAMEKHSYADRRSAGLLHVAVLTGLPAGTGLLFERAVRRHPAGVPLVAVVTWAVVGGRSLRREAASVQARLTAGELQAARVAVRNLVGRDTEDATQQEVARATVESVAENTSDAVVAPLFWGALAGLPGLLGYRAVNTLDAMIGHRSPRYLRFGWAAARLDDVVNWLPARLAALLTAAIAPSVAGSGVAAWRAWRQDARQHPSPNAGVVEAAFAGALGVRLGGTNSYQGRAEERGVLGDGRPVVVGDIARAVRLSRRVSAAALALVISIRLVPGSAWRSPSRS